MDIETLAEHLNDDVTQNTPVESPNNDNINSIRDSVKVNTTGDNEIEDSTTVAPPAGSVYDVKPTEEGDEVVDDDLTLTQRKELKERQYRWEKERRLREFLAVNKKDDQSTVSDLPSSSPNCADRSSDYSPKRGSVAERFEAAKRQQQQQEEERLSRIKNDPNKLVSVGGAFLDTKQRWSNDPSKMYKDYEEDSGWNGSSASSDALRKSTLGLYSRPVDGHISAKLDVDDVGEAGAPERKTRRGSSLRHMWEDVLNESKTTEANRFISTKEQTISQFRETEGSGLVKKRIDEWDELHTQIAATAEQSEEFFKAAQSQAEQKENALLQGLSHDDMQHTFQEGCLSPEVFQINDTHIYPLNCFDVNIRTFLAKHMRDHREKQMMSLSCGVYGDKTSTKPPIDVFSSVMRSGADKLYVTLSIKVVAGKELDPVVYGLKKVNVTVKELGNALLFDKLLNVLPVPGWEQFIEGQESCWEDERARQRLLLPKSSDDNNGRLLSFRNKQVDFSEYGKQELSHTQVDEKLANLGAVEIPVENSLDNETIFDSGDKEDLSGPTVRFQDEILGLSFTELRIESKQVPSQELQFAEDITGPIMNNISVAESHEGQEESSEPDDEGNGTWQSFVTPMKLESDIIASQLTSEVTNEEVWNEYDKDLEDDDNLGEF
jgi:hypothetical protein